MLGVISDTERLANDLSSADLIPYPVKDDVITTNLSRYQKASKLLNEIERSLRVFNKPEILKSYCEVLKKQENPTLTRIANNMLIELGESLIGCFVAMAIFRDYSGIYKMCSLGNCADCLNGLSIM